MSKYPDRLHERVIKEDDGCQYAKDVGMPEHHCAVECQYSVYENARINELEQVCAESYQVLGTLAVEAGRFDDPAVIKALDNLADNALTHKDVLPFPHAKTELEWRESDEYRRRSLIVGAVCAMVLAVMIACVYLGTRLPL